MQSQSMMVPSSTASIYTPPPAAVSRSAPSGAYGGGTLPSIMQESHSQVGTGSFSGGHVPNTINPAMAPPSGSIAPATYTQHYSQGPLGSAPNVAYAAPFGSGNPTPPGSAMPAGVGGSLSQHPPPPQQQPLPLAGGPPPLSNVGQYMPNVSRPQMTQAANPPIVANNMAYGPSYKMQYQRRSTSDKSAVKYTGFLPLEGVYEEDTCRIG
mmetsp:Transcript_7511/g.18986  ORF Transcript_7511/g.18986 Transcript_7511/m.18986 type:complete len:210 (-) Transcript_7511:136-765(-)